MKKKASAVISVCLAAAIVFGGCAGKQTMAETTSTNAVESAYEQAVSKGYSGTAEEWLASLAAETIEGEVSAYGIAVKNGYEGTEQEWLASLVGKKGEAGATSAQGVQGEKGETGDQGAAGADGKSAYELAKEKDATVGTLAQWLDSLKGADGKDGADGKSAYALAVEDGFKGTMGEWLVSLIGADGNDGKSAYELAKKAGYGGTETEWLASLKGEQGEKGATGTQGEKGDKGDKGDAGVGVQTATINAKKHLVITLTDGTQIDVGYIGGGETTDKFNVTFVDYNNSVLKVEQVAAGGSATPPADPSREGYDFAGWSGSYTNVTADTIITATYTGKTPTTTCYKVTFVDHDGTQLKEEDIEEGKSATPPENPTRDGYLFAGWDSDYSSVVSDAKWQTDTYPVVFKYDNELAGLIDTSVLENVEYTVNKTKALPVLHLPGYPFIGWTDESGVLCDQIKPGTSGEKIFYANWIGDRNKAWKAKDLGDPYIYEDDSTILHTYEIGKIENFGKIIAGGVSETRTKEVSTQMSQSLVKEYSSAVEKATTGNATWSLSDGWTDSMSVSEEYAKQQGTSTEVVEAQSKTETGNWYVNNSSGGSQTSTTIDTTDSYDLKTTTNNTKTYGSKDETSYDNHSTEAGWQNNQSLELNHKESVKTSGVLAKLGAEGGLEFEQNLTLAFEQNGKTTDKTGTDTVNKTGSDSDVGGGSQTGTVSNHTTNTAATSNWSNETGFGGSTTDEHCKQVAQAVFTSVTDITLYAHWTRQTLTVTFDGNAEDATVPQPSLVANCGEKLGALPTPVRPYYDFDAWTTAADGSGERVTEETIYQLPEDVTLYAHWIQRGLSGWVKASEAPSDAQIVERKWSYTQRNFTASGNSAEPGWTQYDVQRTSWGGWSDWLTYNPANGVRNVEYHSAYHHTEWHYYRWTNSNHTGLFTYKNANAGCIYLEEAWFNYELPVSSYGYPIYYNGTDNWLGRWVPSCYSGNYSVDKTFTRDIYQDQWRYQDPVYTYYFYMDVDLESGSDPSGSDISNVVEWVQYRSKWSDPAPQNLMAAEDTPQDGETETPTEEETTAEPDNSPVPEESPTPEEESEPEPTPAAAETPSPTEAPQTEVETPIETTAEATEAPLEAVVEE